MLGYFMAHRLIVIVQPLFCLQVHLFSTYNNSAEPKNHEKAWRFPGLLTYHLCTDVMWELQYLLQLPIACTELMSTASSHVVF